MLPGMVIMDEHHRSAVIGCALREEEAFSEGRHLRIGRGCGLGAGGDGCNGQVNDRAGVFAWRPAL